jgi:hypothetical protein
MVEEWAPEGKDGRERINGTKRAVLIKDKHFQQKLAN